MTQFFYIFSRIGRISAALLLCVGLSSCSLDFKQIIDEVIKQNPHQGGLALGDSQIFFTDLKEGAGSSLVNPSRIKVNYKTWLFDDRNEENKGKLVQEAQSAELIWGENRLIEAWEKGLKAVKIGGLRRLTFPSEYGYRELGAGPNIPGGAKLVTEIELLEVNPQSPSLDSTISPSAH